MFIFLLALVALAENYSSQDDMNHDCMENCPLFNTCMNDGACRGCMHHADVETIAMGCWVNPDSEHECCTSHFMGAIQCHMDCHASDGNVNDAEGQHEDTPMWVQPDYEHGAPCEDDPEGILGMMDTTCAIMLASHDCDDFQFDLHNHARRTWQVCPDSCGACSRTDVVTASYGIFSDDQCIHHMDGDVLSHALGTCLPEDHGARSMTMSCEDAGKMAVEFFMNGNCLDSAEWAFTVHYGECMEMHTPEGHQFYLHAFWWGGCAPAYDGSTEDAVGFFSEDSESMSEASWMSTEDVVGSLSDDSESMSEASWMSTEDAVGSFSEDSESMSEASWMSTEEALATSDGDESTMSYDYVSGEDYCESSAMMYDHSACMASSCCHWNDWEGTTPRCWSSIGHDECTDFGDVTSSYSDDESSHDGSGDCVDVEITTHTAYWGHECSWTIDHGACMSAQQYWNHGEFTQTCCLPVGEHTFNCHDSWGDGWNGGFAEVEGQRLCRGYFGSNSDETFTVTGTGVAEMVATEFTAEINPLDLERYNVLIAGLLVTIAASALYCCFRRNKFDNIYQQLLLDEEDEF